MNGYIATANGTLVTTAGTGKVPNNSTNSGNHQPHHVQMMGPVLTNNNIHQQQQQQQQHHTILSNGGQPILISTTVPVTSSPALGNQQLQQYQQTAATGQLTYYNPRAHLNGGVPRPQVSVVIGPAGRLAAQQTTVPSRCCLCCCCCLAPLWYTYCNIYRVIALICNLFVDLLMILCLLSTNWLTTTKYRQGLWQYCIDIDSPRPLPFGITDEDGCHWGREVAYIKLSGFFAVACFVLSIVATILTSFGLSSRDPNRKYTFYRFALYINLAALLAIIVSLTLYPAFFYSELHHSNAIPANRPHWYFGWAYGVGWGSAIFLIGAILLLVCDKETEEIYYKERTIVHANSHNHHQHHQLLRPSPPQAHHQQQQQTQHLVQQQQIYHQQPNHHNSIVKA